MKLKPKRVKVIAKDKESSIRLEINALDKNDEGRKVFSFNLYETTLEEVMEQLILTFEQATSQVFPENVKKEIGMDPGTIIIKRERDKSKKAGMVASVKEAIREGCRVAIPGVLYPDGWLGLLESMEIDIEAEPMMKKDEVKGYIFYRKKE